MPIVLIEMPNYPSRTGAKITEMQDADTILEGYAYACEMLPPPGARDPWTVERTEDYIFPTLETVREICEDVHGSGVDDVWTFQDTRTSYRARNSYHVMNDVGFYVAWVDFAVVFQKKEHIQRFKIVYQSNRYYGEKVDLKDLLYQWMEFSIASVIGTELASLPSRTT